ncbi:MAG: amino acid ABC transporter permease [Aristaeellaceae bacterium]
MIKGNKRLLALISALLLLCLAGMPALADGEGAAAEADKLYTAIDESGYAYVTAAEATVFYADADLNAESANGFLRKKTTLLVTGYTETDSLLVWMMRGDELFSAYLPRTAVKNPLKEASVDSQAEKAGMERMQVEGLNVYVHSASIKPLVNSAFQQWFINLAEDFYKNIIEYDRWLLLLQGLGNTMIMTAGALLIGVVIGILIALVRTVWESTGSKMRPGPGKAILRAVNGLFKVYTTVFRGTPMMVQLLLMTFVILKGIPHAMVVAVISFGLNSGAYVAEIFRGGINSIEKGQMEAGRSIGFNYAQTMWYIIAPQVFKNVLPTLANEFITLIKETSIAAYAGVMELTMAGNRIRGQTFSDFMPLIAVALIYLTIVTILTWLVGKLERRLRQGDNR